MISRGSRGRLHTTWCSASDHYRTTGRGVCCWTRDCWHVLPDQVRYLIAIVVAFVGMSLLTAVAWWLSQGVVL